MSVVFVLMKSFQEYQLSGALFFWTRDPPNFGANKISTCLSVDFIQTSKAGIACIPAAARGRDLNRNCEAHSATYISAFPFVRLDPA
jgi:hypothetical protein